MVTLDRLRQLKRAIACYVDQTYTNRELVIVTDGAAGFCRAVEGHLDALGRDDIRLVVADGTTCTLGSLRNLALASATGDRFCQWDDDDLYHPERLAVQARHLDANGAHACFLADQLQFHWPARRMRWVDWSRDDTFPLTYRAIPGTIMATFDDRFAYPEDGAQACQSEDLAYLTALEDRVPVTTLSGAGHLYVYSYHGRNTFSEEHHTAHNGASNAFLRDRLATAHASAVYYPLPRPFTFVGPGDQTLFVVHDETEAGAGRTI
jgi:glycosyltransferase involved in cell wall biosynthesis